VEALKSVLDPELDATLQEAGVDSLCKLAAAPESRQQLVQQVTAALMLTGNRTHCTCHKDGIAQHMCVYCCVCIAVNRLCSNTYTVAVTKLLAMGITSSRPLALTAARCHCHAFSGLLLIQLCVLPYHTHANSLMTCRVCCTQ